jgi:hypothetical protein
MPSLAGVCYWTKKFWTLVPVPAGVVTCHLPLPFGVP